MGTIAVMKLRFRKQAIARTFEASYHTVLLIAVLADLKVTDLSIFTIKYEFIANLEHQECSWIILLKFFDLHLTSVELIHQTKRAYLQL